MKKNKPMYFGKWIHAKGFMLMNGYKFKKFIDHDADQKLWIEEWWNRQGEVAVLSDCDGKNGAAVEIRFQARKEKKK